DLSAPAAVSQAFLLAAADGAPDRLVIDLTVSDPASFAAASAATAPPAAAAAAPAAPAAGPDTATAGLPGVQRRPIVAGPRVIAIDAGHGGVDPGAIGVRGTYEKSVTLAYAQALAARLQATGRYRVYLTRDQDTFLRLRDRVALARTQGADLFISLHADSNPDKGLRGASVYTLSETASDAESAALAAKENKADIIAGIDLSSENPEVSGILIDLAQRETMNLSARFAGMLTAEMAEAVTVLRHSHRFAGFAVLKAPDVPSVLLELGYLSNREDEAQLNGADHRRAVGDALVRALDAYFAWADALNRT
ncbi:MAG: N-acetylmuramoyl-L-alanine amidase, partial [Alphaproteobacteria bacterium]